MPNTYVHPNAQSANQRTSLSAGQPVVGHAKWTIPTTALGVGDIIKLFRIPAGAKVLSVLTKADDADSNGSPTIAFNLGDTGSANRYLSASNIAQAGGIAESAIGAAFKGYEYTADDTIQIAITAAAATQTAGAAIEVFLTYYSNP